MVQDEDAQIARMTAVNAELGAQLEELEDKVIDLEDNLYGNSDSIFSIFSISGPFRPALYHPTTPRASRGICHVVSMYIAC